MLLGVKRCGYCGLPGDSNLDYSGSRGYRQTSLGLNGSCEVVHRLAGRRACSLRPRSPSRWQRVNRLVLAATDIIYRTSTVYGLYRRSCSAIRRIVRSLTTDPTLTPISSPGPQEPAPEPFPGLRRQFFDTRSREWALPAGFSEPSAESSEALCLATTS